MAVEWIVLLWLAELVGLAAAGMVALAALIAWLLPPDGPDF